MKCELINVAIGDPRYEELLGQIRTDAALLAEMWADAEHRLEEQPDKIWTVAIVDGVPAAWCAARVEDGILRCSDNYERRGAGRDHNLYRDVYRHRHEMVVVPAGLAAVTYLFPGLVIALHEADGWHRTGLCGPGEVDGHEWWELRRDP